MAIRESAEWIGAVDAARNAYIAALRSLAAVVKDTDVPDLLGIMRSGETTERNIANNALQFAVTEHRLAVSDAQLREWTDAVVAMRQDLLTRWQAERATALEAIYCDFIHALPPGIPLAKVVEVLGPPYAEHVGSSRTGPSVCYVEGGTEVQLGADVNGRLEWWKLA